MSYDLPFLLLLCPLPAEAKIVRAELEAQGYSSSKFHGGSFFPELGVLLHASGHGKVQTALTTQRLFIEIPTLQVALLLGTSGALTPELRPGDVVFGESTIEHDFRMIFLSRPLPQFRSAIGLPEGLSFEGFQCVRGAIASGDEDVVSIDRARELFETTRALVVAWEGAGFARASLACRKPFLEIRVVTDSADHLATDQFRQHLQSSLRNGTKVFLALHCSGPLGKFSNN